MPDTLKIDTPHNAKPHLAFQFILLKFFRPFANHTFIAHSVTWTIKFFNIFRKNYNKKAWHYLSTMSGL